MFNKFSECNQTVYILKNLDYKQLVSFLTNLHVIYNLKAHKLQYFIEKY